MTRCLACLLTLAFVCTAAAQDTLTLKRTYPVGKRFVKKVETKQTQTMTTPFSPDPIEQKTNQEQTMAVEVRKGENGGHKISIEYLAIKMDLTAGAQSFSFDSSKPGQGGAHPLAVLGQLAGSTMVLHVGADGEVVKIEGTEAFLEKAGAGNPLVGKMFNKDFFAKSMQAVLSQAGMVEDKSLKPGDTFDMSSEVELPMMGTMVTSAHYTFAGFEQHEGRRAGKLTFTGKISSKKVEQPADAPPAPMQATIKGGSIGGEVFYDPSLGIDLSSTVNQKFEVEIGGAAQGITSKVDSVVKTTLMEIKDL